MKNQQELLEGIVYGIMKRFIANNREEIPKHLEVKMGVCVDSFNVKVVFDYKVEEYYLRLSCDGIHFRNAFYYPTGGDSAIDYDLYDMPDKIVFDYRRE